MGAWRANPGRWAARAEEQAKRDAADAARMLVTGIEVRIYMRAAVLARDPITIQDGPDWHSRAQHSLELIARRAMITSECCMTLVSMSSEQGTALCPIAVSRGDVAHEDFPLRIRLKPTKLFHFHVGPNPVVDEVPVEKVPWGTIQRWPRSNKDCQRIALNFSRVVLARSQADATRSAFKAWQSAWVFSQRTLRELAKDVDDDLLVQELQPDLRRAPSWPSRGRRQRAALHRAATWPSRVNTQRARVQSIKLRALVGYC